ncbi:MAG TPA: nucleotidyltransferase family protein [Rickettsiales bacterium]|nr:nucleotidyltransferase family protein [Rickettsiales bacterium]
MTNSAPKQAMILAAGLGTRMRPLTDSLPKPLVEVAGKPLIDYAIEGLEREGIEKIVVNVSYMADKIVQYLKGRYSAELLFSYEDAPLETGGGIAKALHFFDDKPFFTVNSDVIWIDQGASAIQRMSEMWDNSLDALLLLHPTKDAPGYEGKGDFFADGQGNLTRRTPEGEAPYIYTGIQLLHPRMFVGCPEGKFSINLLYNQAMQSVPPRIRGLVHNGALLNVGDPEGKRLADEYMYKNR